MNLSRARERILGTPVAPGVPVERFKVSLAFAGLVGYMWVIHSNKAALGAVTILGGLAGVLFQKQRIRFPVHLMFFMGFVAWAALTSRFSLDPPATKDALTNFTKLCLVSLLACNVAQTRRQLQILMVAWLGIFALYPVRGTFFNFLHGIQMWGRYAWNFIFQNPNDLAALTLPIIALCVAVLQGDRTKGWVRLSAIAGVAVLPLLIFITQSRGGILALVTLSLLILAQYRRRAKALAIFVVAIGIVAMAAPTSVWDRMRGLEKATTQSELLEADDMGSADQRMEIWKVAAAMAADHPITGVGLGAYPRTNSVYTWKDKLTYDKTARGGRDTHSIYMNVLAETGFVGLLLILCMLGSILWQGTLAVREVSACDPDAAKQIQTLLIGLIAFLQAGIFDTLHRVAFLYLYLGILTSAIAILRTQSLAAGARQPEPERGPFRRGLLHPVESAAARRPTLAPPPFRPSVYQRSR